MAGSKLERRPGKWVQCVVERIIGIKVEGWWHIISLCGSTGELLRFLLENQVTSNVWFQKISIPPPPPPPKNIGNSEGEGAFKGGNFQGVGGGGFMGNYFLKGDGLRTKHWKQCTINLKHKNIPMYVVLKQKSVLLAIDLRLTSLALMFLFFFEFASATISSWNEVEMI